MPLVRDGATDDGSTGEHDWSSRLARRTQSLGGGEITAILALAGATDVITFSGGFPDPATLPTEVLVADRRPPDQPRTPGWRCSTRRPRAWPASATTCRGRVAALEGRRPGAGELMITSGGIDCMELLAKSYLDPGDVVVVEAPTYLGGDHGLPRLRGRRARRAHGRRRAARRRAGRPARGRAAAEDPLHDPGLPEPDRAVAVRGAPGRRWSPWPASTAS